MNGRMRVLEFVTSFCHGGTERQFLNLVQGLRGSDVDVHVACFRAEGRLRDELREDEPPPIPLAEYPFPSLRSPAALRRLAQLARYLRRERIDVVHTTGLYPNVFGVTAAWLARTPAIIASVRDMGSMWSPGLLRVQREACRLADAVVTNAEAVAERLRGEGYPGDKLEVVHNGILPQPPADPAEGAALRASLSLPPEAPLVATICRIDHVKALEHFLSAAARIARRRPDVRFLVVGGRAAGVGPEYVAALHRRARRLGLGGRVTFTGARTDIPRILHELSVSVLSSLSEGLSNALLESMAAGVPVVATAVGGNPEVVDQGVTGFLVPPGDPRALGEAVLRVLESPRLAAELGRAGRVRVETLFTNERMIERTLDLYLRLLARRHRRGHPVLALAGRTEAEPR